MASSVHVEFTADGSGAVREITRINGELVEMRKEMVAVENRSSVMADQTSQSMKEALAQTDRLGDQFQIVGAQAQRASSGVQSAAGSMRNMAGANTQINQLLLETGFVAQDAAFGFRGISNNIPGVVRAFNSARAAAGSTTNLMSSLAASMTGPAGVLFATNALVGALTIATTQFDLFGDSAEDSSEDLTKAEEAANSVAQAIVELGRGDASVDFPEARQRLLELEQQLNDLSEQFDNAAGGPAFDIVQRLRNASINLGSALAFSGESANQLFETLRSRGGEAVQQLGQQIAEQRQQNELWRAQLAILKDLGVEINTLPGTVGEARQEIGELLKENQQARQEFESVDEAIDALFDNDQIERVRRYQQAVEDAARRLRNMEPPEGFGPNADERLFSAEVFAVRDFSQMLGGPALNSINRVEAAIGELERRLGQATSSEKRQQIRGVIDELETWKEEAEGSSDSTTSVGQALNNFDVTALTQGAAALGSIASGAKEADEAIQDLLGNLARTAGASLIQAGRFEIGIPLLLGGELIDAFEHGGRVNTPFQIVGESGPELAQLPRGTRIQSNQETQRTLNGALNQLAGGRGNRIHVTGRLVGEGGDLVAVIDEQVRVNGRSGRDTRFLHR